MLSNDAEVRNRRCVEAGGVIKADEDRVREALRAGRPAAEIGNLLIDVFNPPTVKPATQPLLPDFDLAPASQPHSMPFEADLSSPPPPGTTIVLGGKHRGWRTLAATRGTPSIGSIATETEFTEMFRVLTLGALNELNWEGLFAAGGR